LQVNAPLLVEGQNYGIISTVIVRGCPSQRSRKTVTKRNRERKGQGNGRRAGRVAAATHAAGVEYFTAVQHTVAAEASAQQHRGSDENAACRFCTSRYRVHAWFIEGEGEHSGRHATGEQGRDFAVTDATDVNNQKEGDNQGGSGGEKYVKSPTVASK
jgi:hypothetical protein